MRTRYNWEAMKLEFLQGPWVTFAEYRRFKKMREKMNRYMEGKTAGWATEKKNLVAEAAKRAAGNLLVVKTEEIKQIRERQAKLARMMQLKGAEGLNTLEPKDVEQARKLLATGLQEERLALGVSEKGGAQNLTQVNVNLPKTRFDEIIDAESYEGVLRLIADIKRERTRRLRGGVVVAGEAKV